MSQSPHEDQPFTFVPNGASGEVPPPIMNHKNTASRAIAPPRAPENQRLAKPKRLKAHTVLSKSHSIPVVPRDKKGKPLLPLNVGIMTVISLGEVCKREHFHTERYIFPVGYEVTRRYLSTIDPNAEVVYHCSILDGGDGPKFQIVAGDNPAKPIIAGTATGAWSMIVKTANQIRNRQHSNSVSGPDFFGLAQNTIKHLIQGLPAADQLRDYVWQNFHEGGLGSRPLGGRHASVVPALPDEYESHLNNIRGGRRDDEGGDGDEDPPRHDGPGHHEEFCGRPDMAFPPSPSRHSHRGASRSPVLQRDQQFQFVDSHPAVQASYSSGQGQNGPTLPAGFATIMNAYTEQGSPNQPRPNSCIIRGMGPSAGGREAENRRFDVCFD